jgi:YfiH family protein
MPFQENRAGGLVYMTATNIGAVHAFTARQGGVSTGVYASLNLGYKEGDVEENVRRNYAILGDALGFNPNALVFSRQVHQNGVRVAAGADRRGPFDAIPYEADGLVTAEEELPLIIFTADCAPILLHDPVRGAIGAVHAGWRGTVLNIAGDAVRTMRSALGCRPADIRAAIGPCISACCFETGGMSGTHRGGPRLGSAPVHSAARGKIHGRFKGCQYLLLERAGLLPDNIEKSPNARPAGATSTGRTV